MFVNMSIYRMLQSRLNLYLAGLCMAVLAVKFLLIWRINVNWDEFFYLSHVFTLARGEPVRVLQQAYVHLFAWLTDFGSDEMDRIIAARVVMWALLAVTAFLMAKLASRWVSPAIAWFAPLTYFAVAPVLRHSASFRSDSLLVPVMLVTLIAMTAPAPRRRHYLIAGCAFGISIVVSLKAFLVLPLYVLIAASEGIRQGTTVGARVRRAGWHLIWFGAATALTAGVMLGMHWLAMPGTVPGEGQGFAAAAARKVLLDVPLLPRWDYLQASLTADWPSWLLLAGGLAAAVVTRKRAAILALSVAPVLFYRNAFPYYYVVMLAPASVLAAVGVQALVDAAGSVGQASGAAFRQAWIAVVISMPLILQTALQVADLTYDRQVVQRRAVESVHHIFSEPVPYIDHSGMIASFPKANFFMSSWGVENYLDRGASFMADAIASSRPPLLLANTPVLQPGSPQSVVLLEEDRRLIESSYVPYWGIIWVAGVEVDLPPMATRRARLPFQGRYRVETDSPVVVNGARMGHGDVVVAEGKSTGLDLVLSNESSAANSLRLVWADANPELPADFPPYLPVYSPL